MQGPSISTMSVMVSIMFWRTSMEKTLKEAGLLKDYTTHTRCMSFFLSPVYSFPVYFPFSKLPGFFFGGGSSFTTSNSFFVEETETEETENHP